MPEPEPGAGEEHQDPELAQDEIGAVRDLPGDRAGAGHEAEHEPDQQRPATGTELQLDTTRQGHVHRAEQQAGGDAEREAHRIDLAEPPFRIAEQPGDRRHLIRRTDDAHTIAELQHEVVVGEQVVIASADPRHRHAMEADEIQVGQPAPRHAAVRHDDAAEVEHAAVERQMAVAAFTRIPAERGDGGIGAEDDDGVAGLEAAPTAGDRHRAVVLDPAEADVGVAIDQLGQGREPVGANDDGPADDPFRPRRRGRWGQLGR